MEPAVSTTRTEPATATSPLPDGLQAILDVMERHPDCGIGAFDRARNIGDPATLLAVVGVDVGDHPPLRAGVLAEFVAASDVWVVSDVAAAAAADGAAHRSVTLRSGRPAELHLVRTGAPVVPFVFAIVPLPGDETVELPAMTAIEAGPRMGALRCDFFGNVTAADAVSLAMLGRDRDEFVGSPVINVVHPDDRDEAVVNWVAAKDRRGVALRWRCRLLVGDDRVRWVELTMTNEVDADGGGEVHVELFDVTTEVDAVEALAAERELLGLVTETLPVGVAKFDRDGRIEHANGQLARLLAPSSPSAVFRAAASGTLAPSALSSAFASLLGDGTHAKVDIEVASANGIRHLEWTLRPVLDHDGAVIGGVACVADISESVALRAALEQRATTDPLTGCLNRAGTVATLDRLVDGGGGVGLLFIDLDGFKAINDTLGHHTGDHVLEVVARRLRAAARHDDVIGRLGGDEFVVLMPGLDSAASAYSIAERIAVALRGPARVGVETVDIAASIGVAWRIGGEPDELLSAADSAMYVAKQAGSAAPILSA
jgi:diguanylate cyclase (GGDEF)-like protein